METIPEFVYLDMVVPFLCPADLGVLACVSKDMRVLADNNEAWRIMYIKFRKKSFSVVPTSRHHWRKTWYSCGRNLTRQEWEDAGMPCEQPSHHVHSTLVEDSKKPVNYHNFKRAVAKAIFSRISKFDAGSERQMRFLMYQYENARNQCIECIRKINLAKKRKNAPDKFRAILELPPSTPPHLKSHKRKRARK